MRSSQTRSAVFLAPGATFHADRCEPLRAAVRRGEVRLHALVRRGYPGHPLAPRMLPEVSTVGFWDATVPQSWGLHWHRNEGIELTYLSRGKLDFQVDREAFTLEGGHLTISRPWQVHRVGNPCVGPSRLHWLILDVGVRRPDQVWRWPRWFVLSPADRQRLTTLLSHNEQSVWRANDDLGNCFERLAGLVNTTEPAAVQTKLQLHINELFVILLDLLQEKNATLDSRLTSTRRTVEMFLTALPNHLDRAWNLADMAWQCGLGTSAFAEHCRQVTNLSPMKYLNRCRVERAKKLLAATPKRSVTDIAFECGFESSQYLATVFRQATGLSPRAFRQRNLSGKCPPETRTPASSRR
jgi:AraC-like DNA-binding protein